MPDERVRSALAEMKARQAAKLKEIREALRAEGYERLDQQAQALGLPRSTAYMLIRGNHKASGLTASVLHRMLSSPRLPYGVRTKLLEYIAEKGTGEDGGTRQRLRAFVDRIKRSSAEHGERIKADQLAPPPSRQSPLS